jgi:hypothetical protein
MFNETILTAIALLVNLVGTNYLSLLKQDPFKTGFTTAVKNFTYTIKIKDIYRNIVEGFNLKI